MQSIPSEYLDINRKFRAKLPSNKLDIRPANERICDFEDVILPFEAEIAMYEASRCIHCPDPAPCTVACPVHNDIPSAMWLIEHGEFLEAAKLYRQTSSMPEICGRVCPHDQLCQSSCVRNHYHEPVLTGALEAFVADFERQSTGVTIPVGVSTGFQVALVGAGPAGMACAEQLVMLGHSVTAYDVKPAPGGLLTYGIPNFKLPKNVVLARWCDLQEAGVQFVGNTYIGKDKSIDELFGEGFSAIFVGVGTGIDAKMEVPGEDLPGVFPASEFLMCANTDVELLPEASRNRPKIGNKVVVIGGGDTASDCLRTAIRLGASEVKCLYRRTENEMPGNKKDRMMTKEEGARYDYLVQPIRFIAGENGHLSSIECIRMELGEPDKSGRRRPLPIEGSNFFVEADTAILSLGYWPDTTLGDTTPGLETRKYGLVVINPETGETSRPGVYAGGDAVTGPDLVVTAMKAGRIAAKAIDEYLRETSNKA